MASIDSLVDDIYSTLTTGKMTDKQCDELGKKIALKLKARVGEERGEFTLRFSNLGLPQRKLWYMKNRPDLQKPLSGATRLKFLYGDILEELIIALAKMSGHKVTREQEEVEVEGVKGHIDCDIDDHLVDVKSASRFAYPKFVKGLTPETDSFGYIDQLDSYASASGYSGASFLAINKDTGEMCLDHHDVGLVGEIVDQDNIKSYITIQKSVVDNLEMPDIKCYNDEPHNKSGQRKLGKDCSYCDFKFDCWKDTNDGKGLIIKDYANSVVYLTKVDKDTSETQVQEKEPF